MAVLRHDLETVKPKSIWAFSHFLILRDICALKVALWPNFMSPWTQNPRGWQCFLSMKHNNAIRSCRYRTFLMNFSGLQSLSIELPHCAFESRLPLWPLLVGSTFPLLCVFLFLRPHGLCYPLIYIGAIFQTPLAMIHAWPKRCILAIHNNIYCNHMITCQCGR